MPSGFPASLSLSRSFGSFVRIGYDRLFGHTIRSMTTADHQRPGHLMRRKPAKLQRRQTASSNPQSLSSPLAVITEAGGASAARFIYCNLFAGRAARLHSAHLRDNLLQVVARRVLH